MQERPAIRRDGDAWSLVWQGYDVAMGIERISETRDGLRAEIIVESQAEGRVLGPVGLSLLNSRSQTEFANACAKRVNGLSQETWHAMVVHACASVAKQYRAPQPVINLSRQEVRGPVEYLIPTLVPKAETTILYGDGESAKSLLALRIAFSVTTGEELPWGTRPPQLRVLYLDWETQPDTVATRLRRIAEGESAAVPDLFYRQCFRSLADELPSVREEISKREIGLVIVDSIGFAAGGPLTEDLTAREALNGLRAMSPAARLVVAHVSKDAADQARGKVKPFGSAFFWNGMRSGIEVRRAEDQPDQDVMDLGLFHRKSNDGRHHKPIGLRVLFDGADGAIAFEKSEVSESPDLAMRTPLSQRLRDLLRSGAKDTMTLAEETDSKPETVARTLARMRSVIKLEQGGGRGQPATWGLAE